MILCFAICKSQGVVLAPKGLAIQADTSFVNLKDYSQDFVYDMKYATSDNFLKAQVYDCAQCFLRLKTAMALIGASKAFRVLGYKIKIFDCYRPLDVQKKMWSILPDSKYVANPTTGSIHNRGGAVDISLVDKDGNEVEMGTSFDFFGIEASHGYKKLSSKVKSSRKLLKNIMLLHGFTAQESEWWHYNLNSASGYPLSNTTWNCQ